MKPHSRQIIHMGINFITIPAPQVSHQSALAFQQAVISAGLDFTTAEHRDNIIVLTRQSPSMLQMTVAMLDAQVGQLLVVAPNPKVSLDLFADEALAVADAFAAVWPAPNRQVIKSDVTIRELHETTAPHAFQELWEKTLGQPADTLAAFGRPVKGGGLRLVMDPLAGEESPVVIELKIESFLRDTSKIFVETQFAWPQPSQPGAELDVKEKLAAVDRFSREDVYQFMSGERE
jgi:hypothetical protein